METISRKIDDIELTLLRQQIQFCNTLSLLFLYLIIINFLIKVRAEHQPIHVSFSLGWML
jgi:hypothetical protein